MNRLRSALAIVFSLLCFANTAQAQESIEFLEYPSSDWEQLIPWDTDWLFWADPEAAPPDWPLTTLPESQDALLLLPETEPTTPNGERELRSTPRDQSDRVLLLRNETGNEGLRTDGAWWSGYLAPFSGFSEVRWYVKYDAWKKARARSYRKNKRYWSRTQLVFPVGPKLSELTEEELVVDLEAQEPGLTNMYFVRSFTVDDPSKYTALQVLARFNKGIQVYVNGTLVVRSRLNVNETGHGDYGIEPEHPDFIRMNVAASDRWEYNWDAISPEVLKEGENIISAVVHKPENGETPSLYFDLQLRGWTDVGWMRLPYLHQVTQNAVTVSWQTTVPTRGRVDIMDHTGERVGSFSSSTLTPHHEVVVDGLEPDTSYLYQVYSKPAEPGPSADGSTVSVLSSETLEFTTAPREDASFSFLFYGDSRWGANIHRPLADLMLKDHEKYGSNVVLHAGDIVSTGYSWDLWHDRFFAPAHPLISRVPIYPTVGNHEVNQKLYYDYFDLPGNESWYHFRYGIVDFYSINSNVDYAPGSEQHEWIENALAASTAPWKVAFFHHPPYACANGRKGGGKKVQAHLVPLMEKYGVNLVLLGHDHVYGRSRKVNGVTYVISGGGGSKLYTSSPDAIMESCEKRYNYVRFHVSPASIRWVAIDEKGEIIEEYEIKP